MTSATWTADLGKRYSWMQENLRAWLSMNQYQHLLELLCVLLAIYFYLQRAYKPSRKGGKRMTEEEIESACAKWKSIPLADPPSEEAEQAWLRNKGALEHHRVMTSTAGPMATLEGYDETLNFTSFNFPGLNGDGRILEACENTMKNYGCGSCGPRGFYGTMDVHLDCESRVAKFCGSNDAIIYSFGTATTSSIIPAFCKRGDIVICDEGVSYGVQAGCLLSRSNIIWFKHNDVDDLRRVLQEVRAEDAKDPRRPTRQRRFIVVEGLYTDYGDFAPIKEIVDLKFEFKFRLMVDESNTMGVLGESGHGVCEEFSIPREHIDVSVGDFAPSFGTIGGFCVGERVIVNHQRLSGVGYCFSASQPPYLATAAIEAMNILDEEGKTRAGQLQNLTKKFRELLTHGSGKSVKVLGDERSPIVHLQLLGSGKGIAAQQKLVLEKQEELLREGIYVSAPMYVGMVHKIPEPTLRICLSAAHTEKQVIDAAVKICTVLTRD